MIAFEFNAVAEAVKYRVYIQGNTFGVASVNAVGNRSARTTTNFEGGGDNPMAMIKDVIIKFPVSGSSDIVEYKLYIELSPIIPNHSSPSYDLGNAVAEGILTKNLNEIPEFTTLDGIYNLGVAAVDGAGNESSLTMASNVELDFIAPDPIGEITIERG